MNEAAVMERPGIQWSPAWRTLGLACLLALLVLGLVYSSTIASMVAIWVRSETFTHGFLVLPISLWLIWRRRFLLARFVPAPDWRALPLFLPLGFGWLAAHAADVTVLQQLAFVAMIPLTVVSLLGIRVAREIAFPLAFLFFAVPMGEALMPPMMDFTAAFTVKLLRLTGIPVYVEGTFFSIPSGNWSVVEGCSGIRYLIASVTMGALYAYLNYRSTLKRVLFILFSVAMPVIANGLRAYMIVMIAHLSDMKLALGIDHFIYGWVFFGLVIMLMFWIGSFWRDPDPIDEVPDATAATVSEAVILPSMAWRRALVVVGAGAVWPVWAALLEAGEPVAPPQVELEPPVAHAGWRPVEAFTDWKPHYVGMNGELVQAYESDVGKVGVYLAYYALQKQGAELVNSQNYMIRQKHPIWQNVGEARIGRDDIPEHVVRTYLRSSRQRLYIYHWYWLDGRHTANPWLAKMVEAGNRLLGRHPPAAGIVLFTPYQEGDTDQAEQTMQAFLHDMLPSVEAALRNARIRWAETE